MSLTSPGIEGRVSSIPSWLSSTQVCHQEQRHDGEPVCEGALGTFVDSADVCRCKPCPSQPSSLSAPSPSLVPQALFSTATRALGRVAARRVCSIWTRLSVVAASSWVFCMGLRVWLWFQGSEFAAEVAGSVQAGSARLSSPASAATTTTGSATALLRQPLPSPSRLRLWSRDGAETTGHAMRVMCSGLLDRYPNMQVRIVFGHCSEAISQERLCSAAPWPKATLQVSTITKTSPIRSWDTCRGIPVMGCRELVDCHLRVHAAAGLSEYLHRFRPRR